MQAPFILKNRSQFPITKQRDKYLHTCQPQTLVIGPNFTGFAVTKLKSYGVVRESDYILRLSTKLKRSVKPESQNYTDARGCAT